MKTYWLLAGMLWMVPSLAQADAVPPPPEHCPGGKVPITSHAGPQCVDPAPTDCPAGWRGQLGGRCIVDSCTQDAQCGAGKSCRTAQVCLHEYLQEWGWGASNLLLQNKDSSTLFAEPPQRFNPPRRVVEVVDICRPDKTCPSDWRCADGKVCLPTSVARPGYWPALQPEGKAAAKPSAPSKK